MRCRERGDYSDEASDAIEAERNDETQKKKQMIGSIEDMAKAHPNEGSGRMYPARVESESTETSMNFIGTNRPIGREVANHHLESARQAGRDPKV